MSSAGVDEVALTPAHFLVDSPLLTFPEPYSEEDVRTNLYNRWQLLTNMRNSFWGRWKREVLNQLQQGNKWIKSRINLKEGDVVLIKDEATPPGRWPLGRIITVHPGQDQLVRVATVKSGASEFKRPVVKLIKLPVDVEAEEFHAKRSAT